MDERATQKLAFVVGNSAYAPQPGIPSSNVDASGVANALRQLGFKVTELHDLKRAPDFWEIHLQGFLDQIKENDFVVFYFSGHGLNYKGENFLAMTDFPQAIPESDVRIYLVALSALRSVIAARKPGLSLFLLDACRTIASNITPQDGAPQGINKGMIPLPSTIENVGIGLSSDFGKVSIGRDAQGAMSYYTDALLAHVADEGRELGYVTKKTRLKVMADTNGEQMPWFSESLSAEIYLKPTAQINADEKTAWSSRLATNDYNQIWMFTQEYPVSRYVGAAKRWLAQHGRASTPVTTRLPPQTLDTAFNQNDSNRRVVVPRIDGPYGFPTLPTGAEVSSMSAPSIRTVAEVLAGHQKLVVMRPISAKLSPSEDAETVHTVSAGSTIDVMDIKTKVDGSSWLEVANDGSSTFLPADRALVGSSDVGYSLEEVEVGPGAGLESLVDEKPIRDVVANLKAKGRSISRVSVATAQTTDAKLQLKLSGRVAHTFYLLEQLGIPTGQISATVSPDGLATLSKDSVRVRFFGH